MIDDSYYLWGAGSYGARTIAFFKDHLQFEAVIDSDTKRQGSLFHGLPVISPQEAFEINKKIVISQNVPTSVRTLLCNKGLQENIDFFTLHDFVPRYYWSKEKSLGIKSVDIAVTTLCNKKCTGCQTFIPFAKEGKHFSAEKVLGDIDALFSYVSKVMNINICCGESLLNPELPDICLAIHQKYASRYQTLSLQTNATILPNGADMQKFADAHITLVTSDYPEQKAVTKKLLALCQQYEISWIINSSGNRKLWYDLGDPRMPWEQDASVLEARYERCWKPGMGLHNGWLYICGAQLWAELVAGAGEIEYGDAYNLRQPVTEENRDALRRILFREAPEKGYISHCTRCFSVMNPMRTV